MGWKSELGGFLPNCVCMLTITEGTLQRCPSAGGGGCLPRPLIPARIPLPLAKASHEAITGVTEWVAQTVKNLPVMPDIWVRSLGWEDPLEKGKATHSSILAWRIPWTV